MPKNVVLYPNAGGSTLVMREVDGYIADEIFKDEVYACIPLATDNPRILDLGANIGCAALWFRNRYPRCDVFCVEPDEDNYILLRENLRQTHFRSIRAAAFNVFCHLGLFSPKEDDRPCAYRVRPNGSVCVGLPMSALISMTGFERVDLVKMDIEGAEEDVFLRGSLDWTSYVDNIVCEVHDLSLKDTLKDILRQREFRTSFMPETRLLVGTKT